MTLDEFKSLDSLQMCELMNKHMENHTAKNFKTGGMAFTLNQAESALAEKGIYKMNGIYWTEEQMLQFLNEKKKERHKKELSQENIEQLLKLLEPGKVEKLIKLAENYDYVASFILREDRGIKIKTGEGKPRTTTIRVYEETMEQWKEFLAENKAYTALDLLNTALVEFMERHKYN